MFTMTTALRDKIRRRMVVSAENHFVNVPCSPSSEEFEPDSEFRLIKVGSIISSSSSTTTSSSSCSESTTKTSLSSFSDTDSGVSSNTVSEDSDILPDPSRDVVYDSSTPAFDPEEDDDFDIKLHRSLANLGIGLNSGRRDSCISDDSSILSLSSSLFLPIGIPAVGIEEEGDYYDNVGPLVDYANFDIDLDQLGVDFDIVEPPPGFAEENPSENEMRQLLVVENETEDEIDESSCVSPAPVNVQSLEDLNKVLDNLITVDDINDSPCPCPKVLGTKEEQEKHATPVLLETSKPVELAKETNNVDSQRDLQNTQTVSNPTQNDPKPDESNNNSNPKGNNKKSKKKRKRERYEIRLGYACYNLELEDKNVSIYSLQKNRDMMEDLLGHSKLKNSKSTCLCSL